jgi:hypothetical protein
MNKDVMLINICLKLDEPWSIYGYLIRFLAEQYFNYAREKCGGKFIWKGTPYF